MALFPLLGGLLVLPGCVLPPVEDVANGVPMPLHDTRLQYALLSNDQRMLQRDFRLDRPASPVERALSAFMLPFSVGTETAFLPLSLSMQALADWGSPPPGRTLK